MTNAAERKARLDQLLNELIATQPATTDRKKLARKLTTIMRADPEKHRELAMLMIEELLERDRRYLDPNFVERH